MPDSCWSTNAASTTKRLAAAVLGVEAHVLEQFLHHRLQPPRADILDRLVDLGGDPRERLDAVVGEARR